MGYLESLSQMQRLYSVIEFEPNLARDTKTIC